MKLVFKREQKEEVKTSRAGVRQSEFHYSLACKLVFSEGEKDILTRYVGLDSTLTYTVGRYESGFLGMKIKTDSTEEYASKEEAKQHCGESQSAVPKHSVSDLIQGVSYVEVGGISSLLRKESALTEACQGLKNQMDNRLSYGGEEEVVFD